MASSSGESNNVDCARNSVENDVGASTSSNKRKGKECNKDNDVEIYFNRNWKSEVLKRQHASYFKAILFGKLSSAYQDLDTQRMTFLHFVVSGLDILNALETTLKPEEKQNIIDWIYYHQIIGNPVERCGFTGSTTFKLRGLPKKQMTLPVPLYSGHLTMTYAALVTLLTLGDDLDRLDRDAILKGVSALQTHDGCFQAGLGCTEKDMRFVYCAVCTCYILNDFTFINVPKLVEFIKSSFTYEGSFTSGYAVEGHAAYTFCAVASLFLLNRFTDALSKEETERLKRWCLFREDSGFCGRPNKSEDTCYSYWVGATLALLNSLYLLDHDANINFLLGNQNPIRGGIGKCDNGYVDPLHTFMGLAGLSLVKHGGLNPINPMLTMSENAVAHLKRLHAKWGGA